MAKAELKKNLMPPAGVFITFEGGEGSGKSSQIKRLQEKFESEGLGTVVTREPGGTAGAEIIRHVILSGAAEKYGHDVEAMLFSAARSDHVEQVIRPALEAGKIVLCDRFVDSTRVYQGVCGNVSMKYLEELEKVACEGVWPNVTLVLDIDPHEGMKRAKARREDNAKPDRFEKENMAIQSKRRNAFIAITEKDPERCFLIDASGTETVVANRIWKVVQHVLERIEHPSVAS